MDRIDDVEEAHRQALVEEDYCGVLCVEGVESFPILYEDRWVRVYKNPYNELFIEATQPGDNRIGATMRISSCRGGLEFTSDGLVTPTHVHGGALGWRVHPLC